MLVRRSSLKLLPVPLPGGSISYPLTTSTTGKIDASHFWGRGWGAPQNVQTPSSPSSFVGHPLVISRLPGRSTTPHTHTTWEANRLDQTPHLNALGVQGQTNVLQGGVGEGALGLQRIRELRLHLRRNGTHDLGGDITVIELLDCELDVSHYSTI